MRRDAFHSALASAGPESAAHISPNAFTGSSARQRLILRSQPMQRSTGIRLSYSDENPPSPSCESVFGQVSTTSLSPKYLTLEGLHVQLKGNDPALLRMPHFAQRFTL